MAEKEGEVVVLPAEDGEHVDVRDEVDHVEREPAGAEDDDHADAETVVLLLPLLLRLLLGRGLPGAAGPGREPLGQPGHDHARNKSNKE